MGARDSLRLVVLISGGGTNLQSIIDAIADGKLNAEIAAVISNQPEAFGLTRAAQAGIQTDTLSHKEFDNRQAYDAELAQRIDKHQPDLIILAGFMRILSADFVSRFRDRILNIHPALLPKFKGTDTHQRAIDAGESEHGATVHLATEQLDDGPTLLQATVPVFEDDSAETLQQRVLAQEHIIYPRAIQMLADGRLRIENGAVIAARN